MTVAQDRNLQIEPLDVPSAILQRRSIKSFKPDAIELELLRRLVKLTVAAPSSDNIQDRRIVATEPRKNPDRLTFSANGLVDRINNSYNR